MPILGSAPAGREWSLICDGPAYSACLAAWERPGQGGIPDPERVFETIWTVEPELVREASSIFIGLIARSAPQLGAALAEDLAERPLSSLVDHVGQVTALTSRMVAYMAGQRDLREIRVPRS